MKAGPWIKTALVAAAVVAYPLALHLLLTSSHWSRESVAWFNLAQTVGAQSLLAWLFGRTLRAGREPLIALIARRVHGKDYTPAIAQYARQATWAWTLFFVAMAVLPLLLFVTVSLEAWSFFVNILWWPLLIAMFAGEYLARRIILRNVQHVSILRSVSLFREERRHEAAGD